MKRAQRTRTCTQLSWGWEQAWGLVICAPVAPFGGLGHFQTPRPGLRLSLAACWNHLGSVQHPQATFGFATSPGGLKHMATFNRGVPVVSVQAGLEFGM